MNKEMSDQGMQGAIVPDETYFVSSYLAFEHLIERMQSPNGLLLVTIVHTEDRLDSSRAQMGK